MSLMNWFENGLEEKGGLRRKMWPREETIFQRDVG
jgi:hypothetical protein